MMDRYLLAEELHDAYFEARNGPGNVLPLRLSTVEERQQWAAVAVKAMRLLRPEEFREVNR